MKLLKVLKYIVMAWVMINAVATIALSLLYLFNMTNPHIELANIPMFSAVIGIFVYIVIDHQLKKKNT